MAERELAKENDREGDTAAETAVDRALAADPNHLRANVLKAQLMMARLQDDDGATEADWDTVQRHIRIANKLNSEDPMPLIAFVDSYRHQYKQAPPISLEALRKAHSLVPEATEVRVNYAFALALEERYDEAIKLVEFLAADPHMGQAGKAVLGQIRAMRDDTVYAPMDDLEVPAPAGEE